MPNYIDSFQKPSAESLNAQLSELNVRSRWYAGRLWQLPFAYLAVVAIGLTGLDPKETRELSRFLPLTLIGLGFLVLFCMLGTSRAICRAVQNIARIEAELALERTVRTHPILIEAPYYLMVFSGIVVCCLQVGFADV